MFDFDLTDELKLKIRKLIKKDKKKVEIINKKIKEIINNDKESIERYKNLKYRLKELKRIHIDNHFVLTFKIDKENNFILFVDFDHHDNVYKNKSN
ncbi:MAG: addiction module toxin RelE [Nanoarchaeota archaeon]|nr:addiction module toxin RelE [Nanoarchaeota archaeon]